MNDKERAAMQRALEALEELHYSSGTVVAAKKYESATASLREALAEQAEQEPIGEMIDKSGYKGAAWYLEPPATGTKLYAAPVRTKDLTDGEIAKACGWEFGQPLYEWVIGLAREAIAADREKNK